MFYYASHGLSIASEVPLPELPSVDEPDPAVDVTVRIDELGESADEHTYHRRTVEEICFTIPIVGTMLVRAGEEIVVDPVVDVDDPLVRLIVLGPCLGSLMHQRGSLVLHGSGLVVDGRAIVLLGPSGAGKSTTAAALARRGHEVVTDDHVVVSGDEPPTVQPAFPALKLADETVQTLDLDWPKIADTVASVEKSYFRTASSAVDEPLPIDAAYFVTTGDELTIEPVRGPEAVVDLVGHTYAAHLLPDLDATERNFLQCGRFARSVRLRRLQRVDGFDRLDEVARVIERDVVRAVQ